LDNGLQVVLEENHTAPVVAFQAWVKTGSADEPPELAGVAHVFEHMLFKGTKKRGVGIIAQEVEGAGGEINAWTSYDETVYHLVLASAFFDTGLDILADTLQASAFDPGELERERKVVLEEIKQGLDDPDRMAAQGLFRAAFPGHPYGRPVIGSEETVRALKRADLLRLFAKQYVAANVTLVVVGDFDAKQARAAITRAFGAMPAGKPSAKRAAPPPPKGPRLETAARDSKEAHLLLGFRVPAIEDADIPALDLLSVVLGQGESSRLNLEVVRNRQLVTTASAYVFSGRDAGLMVVSANMMPGRLEEASRVMLDEALRLAREEIGADELAKARMLLESDRIYDRETVQGHARKLGFFASMTGDVAFEDRYVARLQALTPADLRAVAAKYLRSENLTAFAQVPEPRADKRSERAARAAERLRPVLAGAEVRANRRWARPAVGASAGDKVVRHVLPSGLRALVLRDPSVPVVAVRATWMGGLRFEEPSSAGISNMVASLLTRGTRNRSAEAIIKEVEAMAGSLSGYAGRNSLGLQAEFLSRHWDRGLELVADCLLNATFSEEELEKERRLVLEDLRAQDDNLAHVAFQTFHEALWKKHPYRLDALGTPASVGGFTRRKLANHYRRHYGVNNLTIAIVGDVDPEKVVARLGALFAEGSRAPAEAPELPAESPPPAPVQAFRFLDKEQAHVVLGFPGTTFDSPDRFPLEVLTQVLSGQGGRLFVEIREKRALAYRVSAFSHEGVDPGYVAVYLATGPERLDEAVAAVREELQKIVAAGISAAELERAQRYLVGTQAIGLQRKSAIAAALAFHEAHGQGWRAYRQYSDKIRKVKLEDVSRVARHYLDPGREVMAVVKPREATPAAAPRVGQAAPGPGETVRTKAAARSSGR
jgi:zinc protease